MAEVDGPADPHVIAPGMAPTPFTAAEIRDGCPQGRTVTVRAQHADGPPRLETTRWVSCDDEGAVMEKTVHDSSGEGVAERESYRMAWRELQAHAAFPRDRTEITRETIVTEAGLFECLRYSVEGEEGGSDFWFALELPGMPIRVQAPDFKMELVENVGGTQGHPSG